MYKIRVRRHNRRPLEIKYLHIGKALGISYKEARGAMDKLVQSGRIEKFRSWTTTENGYLRKNYYRELIH